MSWHLYVRFQEMELRDAYWGQVTAMPQLAPLLEAFTLRTSLYPAHPVAAFEHNDRAALAPLARWTLDFWPSAQIELCQTADAPESPWLQCCTCAPGTHAAPSTF